MASVIVEERESECVRVCNSTAKEELKVVASESYCTSSHHSDSLLGFVDPVVFPYFWVFHVNILCLCYLRVLSSVFLFVHIYLDLCIRIYTRVNRLWPVTFLTHITFFLVHEHFFGRNMKPSRICKVITYMHDLNEV